jgi:hypothetical protein
MRGGGREEGEEEGEEEERRGRGERKRGALGSA